MIGGQTVPKLSRRRAIVELAYYVVTDGRGAFGSPVQQAVVEGRQYQPGQPGTSCVELPDCVMFAAGCRADCINRDEHHGRHIQRDLGWYLHGSKHDGEVIDSPRLDQLRPGDLIGYDFDRSAHAAIFLGRDGDHVVLTADYGQWHGGGRLYRCSVGQVGPYLTLRGRYVWAAVNVDTLSYEAPALTVGQWCREHGLEVEPWMPAEYLVEQWEEMDA
jgi:hypothetical protein